MISFLKSATTVVVIVLVLQWTGLASGVSQVFQTAALKLGVLDAKPEYLKKPDPFDYSFMIKDMDGNKISFEQFKGKVVFLNLWATWCGPCRAEMPTIQRLYESIPTGNVAFVILSLDKDQDKNKIESYIKSKKYSFPVYQPSGYLTEQVQVPSIPTTFVINKKGLVVAKETGATNFNTPKFRKFIESLIKE